MLHSQPHPVPGRGNLTGSSAKLVPSQCNIDRNMSDPLTADMNDENMMLGEPLSVEPGMKPLERMERSSLESESSPEHNCNADVMVEHCVSTSSDEQSSSTAVVTDRVQYGELIILGYNGSLPQGENDRRRSKYELVQRPHPNGIRKSKHYCVTEAKTSEAIRDKRQHSISFTLNRSQAIIVEYEHDEDTDLFQIGRSSESPIDFVVIDTQAFEQSNKVPYHVFKYGLKGEPEEFAPVNKVQHSTISRFACRILVDRRPPYTARIYAAGFDSSKNIFLGEKATKWQTIGEIDGLTTNGILIMHPKTTFIETGRDGEGEQEVSRGGVWREVSVCGEIYSVRETRSALQKGVKIDNEYNILKDGTLIDLCGATLMWRSASGLSLSPTKIELDKMLDSLNALRPQCPVGLNTLVIPRKNILKAQIDEKQPFVYLKCGHVQGYHDWGQTKHANQRTCPMCFKSGPIVRLSMGIEPAFLTSNDLPTLCFNPCGHIVSESTAKYWSQVLIPHGTNGFHAMCPFCAIPLHEPGYVKLIFQ